MTDDKHREAFERWARKHFLDLHPWNEPARGALPNDYRKIETDMAWSGWQAAIRHMREQEDKA